jgi:hypothetical protein
MRQLNHIIRFQHAGQDHRTCNGITEPPYSGRFLHLQFDEFSGPRTDREAQQDETQHPRNNSAETHHRLLFLTLKKKIGD